MSSTPSRSSSGSSCDAPRPASSRYWRRPGSGRRRPRGRPRGWPGRAGRRHLILSAGKCGRARGPLGHDVGLVDPDREVGRREVGRQAEQLVDRAAGRPCRSRSCSAMSMAQLRRAVAADRAPPSPIGGAAARPRVGSRLADRVEQQREDGRHRRRGLAVEPVRVALPHPRRCPGNRSSRSSTTTVVTPCPARGRCGRCGTGRAGRACRTSWVSEAQSRTPRPTAARRPPSRIGRPQPIRAEADRVVGRQAGLGGGRAR